MSAAGFEPGSSRSKADSLTSRPSCAVSELLCSMRCSTTGWESFQFENGTCEVLKAHWPTDDMVRYKEYGNTTELEVARHKPISASPNYGSNLPPLAVDGDITTFYHSATNLNTPWIMVDLGGGFLVTKVRILPRDYVDYSHRFMDAQVLVGEVEPITPGNFSQFTVVGTIDGPIMPVDWRDFEVLPARCSRCAPTSLYCTVATRSRQSTLLSPVYSTLASLLYSRQSMYSGNLSRNVGSTPVVVAVFLSDGSRFTDLRLSISSSQLSVWLPVSISVLDIGPTSALILIVFMNKFTIYKDDRITALEEIPLNNRSRKFSVS
ncbi:Galactose-binding domain-like [Trinorchestia longiramus]|nr:Galactose-binding domain-like [Trinorchestia longiramus]